MLEQRKGRKKTGKNRGFSPLSLSIRRPLLCWSLNEEGASPDALVCANAHFKYVAALSRGQEGGPQKKKAW